MSNSNLVSYTAISPNSSNPRNAEIDTITIHCMAGDLSLETCGNIFANENTQASSNYGIDSEGNIGMYVEEENRSWATSSRDNDHRAITIEVANCGGEPDWPVTEAAMESLIALCTDICQRNGIPQLLWQANPELIGQVDQQNMTVHRWYAQKACPGDYLFNMHGFIAQEVNKRLGVQSNEPAAQTPNVDEAIWRFFEAKGLNPCANAGLDGNIFAESGLIPTNLQNNFEDSLGMTDEEYTRAVDDGSYTNFVNDSAGYGLCQWTYYTRKQALLDFAKASGTSIGDLYMQLEYLWKELNDTIDIAALNASQTVREASDIILFQFERPADQSEEVQECRAGYGQEFYNKFVSGIVAPEVPSQETTVGSFVVKVVADILNIRCAPGTGNEIVGEITDQGQYTIVELADGDGASKWGRLKSGAGWISMDYTQRV